MKREIMKFLSFILRLFSFKRCNLPRTFLLILLLSLLSCLIFLYRVMDPELKVRKSNPPTPHVRCLSDSVESDIHNPHKHRTEKRMRFAHRALLITESINSKGGQKIKNFLSSLRIDVKTEHKSKTLPQMSTKRAGRFAIVIFEDYNTYLKLERWNRQLIDKYCRDYHVSIIGFVHPQAENTIGYSRAEGYHLTFQYNIMLEDYKLEPHSKLWRVTKPHAVWKGSLPDKWTVFHYNHSTYKPLAYSRLSSKFLEFDAGDQTDLTFKYVTALHDDGLIDGIRKILLGHSLEFWIFKMMMLDALSYLTFGKLEVTLDRYIQVDVDDIFVGKEGIRMKVPDVEEMVKSQARLAKEIDGFRFNLGYSGGFYLYGTEEEDAGDRKLIEYSDKFRWFSHMYRHEQPHKYGPSHVEDSMIRNKKFAEDHDIEVKGYYAVAPHHSGVYPVMEHLYSSWKSVWGIKVTSTEEYPRLIPAWKRRGFIHRGIMVLPRQTCGLFTHIVYSSDFPGGMSELNRYIQGGDLFITILTTPINVFMTHLSNYGNDRLALYLFESIVSFINCWTNLRLLSLPPLELGVKYFEMYPQDKDPVWTNPCDYERHHEIWPANKTCDRLPDFIIAGPQKTGTTALHSFLSQHPSVVSNYKSDKTYEEIQFFNSNNYYQGLDCYLLTDAESYAEGHRMRPYFPGGTGCIKVYMEFFPKTHNANTTLLFEKSANYFDSDLVPKRVSALLPKTKIVIILMNPALRAYSWYQHQLYHKDPTAIKHSFYEVISASDMAPLALHSLRNRCLSPGLYAQHIIRWLDYFPSKQIHIVHSDDLRNDPVSVMHFLQKFLRVDPYLDYSQLLRFDPDKGFFCQVVDERQNKCLGRSKGHSYEPMDQESEHHLRLFYRKHNINLSKLLPTLNADLPDWLKHELQEADLMRKH